MAPTLRADRRPSGSEPDVQTATPNGFIEKQDVYIARVLSGLSIHLYHTLMAGAGGIEPPSPGSKPVTLTVVLRPYKYKTHSKNIKVFI